MSFWESNFTLTGRQSFGVYFFFVLLFCNFVICFQISFVGESYQQLRDERKKVQQEVCLSLARTQRAINRFFKVTNSGNCYSRARVAENSNFSFSRARQTHFQQVSEEDQCFPLRAHKSRTISLCTRSKESIDCSMAILKQLFTKSSISITRNSEICFNFFFTSNLNSSNIC